MLYLFNPMNYASYNSPSYALLKFNEPMISFSSAWRHTLPFTSQQMMSLRTTTAGRPASSARAGRHICRAHKPGLKAAAAVSSSTNGLPVVVSPERSKVEAEDMEAAAFCPPVRRPVAGSVATEDMTLVHNRVNSFVEEEIEISVNGGSSTELGPEEGLGIVRFLTGKKLLITGATGFLAKVLIEKILRVAPDVGKIYVLIKAKDKDDAKRRMISEIINTELFERHREVYGRDYHNFLKSKLVPVVGNVRDHDLGIDPELANEITDEVDIIVNSAANTTFDESRSDKEAFI